MCRSFPSPSAARIVSGRRAVISPGWHRSKSLTILCFLSSKDPMKRKALARDVKAIGSRESFAPHSESGLQTTDYGRSTRFNLSMVYRPSSMVHHHRFPEPLSLRRGPARCLRGPLAYKYEAEHPKSL